MNRYLKFIKYSFKEQRQYRTNFFASIGTMLFNDACFLIIFVIFLGYFTETWLTFGNFLILTSMSCLGYGVVHGLFYNIGALPYIIEQWKLDYYLSFPVNPLYFLASIRIWIADFWDIIFGTICLIIYAVHYAEAPVWIVLFKGFWVLILSWIIVLGLYIMVGSISFWVQKGSKIAELFNSTIISFSLYPPEIYKENKMIFLLMCILLFPWIILPYWIMTGDSTIWQRLLMIVLALIILPFGIFVFNRWLKRYSSWNLVHQM